MKIVATTSLPAVDRPNADRWNAARSRQKNAREQDDFQSLEVVMCHQYPQDNHLVDILVR